MSHVAIPHRDSIDSRRPSLRLPATLLLTGQLLYIVVTLLHTDGPANDHHTVFADYAESHAWTAVHLGQFAAMATLLAGMITLFNALDIAGTTARWASRFGGASAVAALALYGALQAVDGVALKQAVDAWVAAPDAEKASRFATAEAIRWLEWGMRSYQDIALGLALLLLAVAIARTPRVPRPLGFVVGLTGLTYLTQGWVAGSDGFSPAQSILIVVAFIVGLAWMTWLTVIAWRSREV